MVAVEKEVLFLNIAHMDTTFLEQQVTLALVSSLCCICVWVYLF